MLRPSLKSGVFVALLLASGSASAARVKELADMRGARANQLVGYGLVVGLAGTGDDPQAGFSGQSTATLLQHLGIRIDPNKILPRNVAAVIVTAELPAFAATGTRLDVVVASLGSATSLEGGSLVLTPLRGADRQVYAVAQGSLIVGGYVAAGQSGTRVSKNQATSGRIPGGAIVEREITKPPVVGEFEVLLRQPDFTTAQRLANAIHDAMTAQGMETAKKPPPTPEGGEEVVLKLAAAKDPGTVVVEIPATYAQRYVELWSMLESVEIDPDRPTRVVVNERTGTVVLGDGVRLSPVAIAHGGITLEVKEQPQVSQPNPFARGNTAVVPGSNVQAKEGRGELKELPAGASLSDVVKALNSLGVSAKDLVTILQAIKASGAMNAELVVQ